MVNPKKIAMFLPACVLAAVTVLYAADQNKPAGGDAVNKSVAAAPAKPAPAASGVVVFKDPVTGQIRQPEAAEIRQLLQQAPVGKAAPMQTEAVRHLSGPRGEVGMTLPESSMISVVVTKGADGKLATECVGGGQAAAAARVTAGATASKKVENKEALDVK